jgi:uncharacterized protein YbcI
LKEQKIFLESEDIRRNAVVVELEEKLAKVENKLNEYEKKRSEIESERNTLSAQGVTIPWEVQEQLHRK